MAYKNRRYVNSDPYWLAARFGSVCTCGKAIRKGDRIFYFPKGKRAFCEPCGKVEERGIIAERSMDRFGSDCGYDY